MEAMKLLVTAAFAGLCAIAQTPAHSALDSLTLPTYQEGLPDVNPPFDQFQIVFQHPYVYPYTLRPGFSSIRRDEAWRALTLENDYLRCIILPDLGGHVYNCVDKISGRDMFYANTSIKKQDVGLRGAWVALGLETNFPNGHSWVSVSPIDFAYADHDDGSASVWVANTDRVTGMRWRCEFVLRAGAGVLEQRVTLENPTQVRRRYYYWANAGARLTGNADRFIIPAHLASVHGSGVVDTWPKSRSGQDLSLLGSYTDSVGYFAIGSRENFMAFYQAGAKSGLVHVANAADVPGKKIWTWGTYPWPVTNLSDDNSSYVEIQGGGTESQTTYYYLNPLESRSFVEYWLPIRRLGGLTMANQFAILNLTRTLGYKLTAELVVMQPIPGATIRIWQDGILQTQSKGDLMPDQFSNIVIGVSASSPVVYELLDATGAVVLTQTEGQIDADTPDGYTLGAQPSPAWLTAPKTEADFLSLTDYNERWADYDPGLANYAAGLKRYPQSQPLASGLGRLWDVLANPSAASPYLSTGASDAETRYYGALARQDQAALTALLSDANFGGAAGVALARLLAQSGKFDDALTALRTGTAFPGAVELALLRALERWDELGARAAYWYGVDPTNSLVRYELYRLGQDDGSLWAHLADDPDRILNLAEHLMSLGQYADALAVLSADYSGVEPIELEPGTPLASQHPLIWYYRGFTKEKTRQSGAAEYQKAATLAVRFLFPNREWTLTVLNAALTASPSDPNALWLRGCVYLAMRRTDDAIADWTKVRTLRPTTPSLHRTLGRAWLDIKGNKATALPILQEGLQYDPGNPDLLNAISRAKAQ